MFYSYHDFQISPQITIIIERITNIDNLIYIHHYYPIIDLCLMWKVKSNDAMRNKNRVVQDKDFFKKIYKSLP